MNPAPLDDSDLDRLEQLLEADVFQGDAMRLDEIQAMLCAIVSGPVPVAPSVWLPEALGKGLESASDPQVLEALDLLMRLNNDLASALLNDETIAPVLYPLDETGAEYDYEAWADTYVFGAGIGGAAVVAGLHGEGRGAGGVGGGGVGEGADVGNNRRNQEHRQIGSASRRERE